MCIGWAGFEPARTMQPPRFSCAQLPDAGDKRSKLPSGLDEPGPRWGAGVSGYYSTIPIFLAFALKTVTIHPRDFENSILHPIRSR